MNAIEMAISSALNKMMGNLSERLPELLSALPPDVLANIGQIRDVVTAYKSQLDRIENQNRLIIAFLNIPAETEIRSNGDARLLGHDAERTDGAAAEPA